ncbi:Luciferase-like monooxygenase [Kribbella flavida DSM 17836]|uniref:Luciferase-like monooxygenase n=1 Tax=Kribbella flavida (strain DSM 17836 / JCM 10339 / NBRC 14399) TaxID=479435 RepID=D2PT85_KRIFD|nr:LLM class flavin-dependent oxidoreductase [Kribbella flavida]ADB29401.1 Luciferase-like monooxygenase [Kribbella flavida DSM 17836]
MKLGVMVPVGGSDGPDGQLPGWADTRRLAEAAEQSGLDSVWLADHFFYRDPAGTTYGMHEAWTLLSALAVVTSRVELGTMVLCASFRDPGLVAKMAATLDEVSGGRLILGVGAGWHDPEYEANGLPTDHRVGRFEEWLEIVARLVRGETVSMEGKYYTVVDNALVPAPQRRIPVLVAALRPRMLDLTAQWADAWNTAWFGAVDEKVRERLDDFDAALERNQRPAGEVATTVGVTVRDPDQPAIPDGASNALAGTVEELAEALTEYAALGVDHLVVGLEPMTPRSVERLAEAGRLAFG